VLETSPCACAMVPNVTVMPEAATDMMGSFRVRER
jgi:hypothetical protein